MDFRDYLNKLEDISADHEPMVGDIVEIELGDTLVETYIEDITEDGVVVKLDETALKLIIDARKELLESKQSVAEGLNEFAVDSSNGGDDDEYDLLFKLVKMWWLGNEQQHFKAEKTLTSMGISIEENEPDIILHRGKQFLKFPMDDFEQGAAEGEIDEAKYQGREVPLNKPMAGDVKKSKVYVKKPNGKVVKVNFGDKKMRIKKSNPKRRKSFRARHRCENPGPKWKARYWSCRAW